MKIKIASRSSKLALKQVEEFIKTFSIEDFDLIEITTQGDKIWFTHGINIFFSTYFKIFEILDRGNALKYHICKIIDHSLIIYRLCFKQRDMLN